MRRISTKSLLRSSLCARLPLLKSYSAPIAAPSVASTPILIRTAEQPKRFFVSPSIANQKDKQKAGVSATSPRKVPKLFKSVAEYRKWRENEVKKGRTIGFVPTMGALHDGHISLTKHAAAHDTSVVVSIFVNPAQFAPHEDLNAYPRTVPEDLALLTAAGTVDAVLVPSVSEMYPSGITTHVKEQKGTFVEVLGLGARMEGTIRPHFFRGVATVVTKLLNIAQPSTLYLGQKDFQQCSILRHMIHDLLLPVSLTVVPTIREPSDNLAMSSRNRYLSTQERSVAGTLYAGLAAGREVVLSKNGARVNRDDILRAAEQSILRVIEAEKAKGDAGVTMGLEYLSLVDPWTLDEVDALEDVRDVEGGENVFAGAEGGKAKGAVISGAIKVGKTRLIDNLLIGCTL